MRILGIDPGYAIVGYGIVDFAGINFLLLIMVVSPLHLKQIFQRD